MVETIVSKRQGREALARGKTDANRMTFYCFVDAEVGLDAVEALCHALQLGILYRRDLGNSPRQAAQEKSGV